MQYLFAGCELLRSIDLSSFTTKKIKYMDGMFYKCYHLQKIDISSFDDNAKCDYIFDKDIPPSGTVRINKNITGKLSNKLPRVWTFYLVYPK